MPDDDPLLDRAIDLHRLRLEHQDPAERVRATLDLADAYLQRADRLAGVEFEGAEYRGREMAAVSRLQVDALQRAAEAYEHVLRSDHPVAARRRAEVRFGLAEIRRRQGDDEAARAHLHALIRDHPDHGLAPATLLHLGDDAFAEQRFDLARGLYTRAVASGDPSTTTYARYKLGWIAINEDDGTTALEHWSRVVLESRHDPMRQGLAEAAAKDCVRAYVMVGRPETAAAFFSRLHPERAHQLLENLALRYEAEGRTDDAAVVRGRAPGPPPRP